MERRLKVEHDHFDLAELLSNLGACLSWEGKWKEGSSYTTEGLAMLQRVLGDRDHPTLAFRNFSIAKGYEESGMIGEARQHYEAAASMVERLRQGSRISETLKQSYFDRLKDEGVFERLQAILAVQGKVEESLFAAERSRSRGLMDLLEQQDVDPLLQAAEEARDRGAAAVHERIEALRKNLREVEVEQDRTLLKLTRLDEANLDDAGRETKRRKLLDETASATRKHRQLLDERARLVAEVLPTGRARTAAEIRSALRQGELLVEFTVNQHVAMVHAVGSKSDEAGVQYFPLPTALAVIEEALPIVLSQASHNSLAPARGRTPKGETSEPAAAVKGSQQLFAALFPPELWARIRASKRVFLAGHGGLHRLPFELLVTGIEQGKPVHWLDNGPEIAYLPSGSALHWLRNRKGVIPGRSKPELDILTVGDPETRGGESGSAETSRDVASVDQLRRAGDLERLRQMPRLVGARAEATSIVAQWTQKGRKGKALLGVEATEPAVLEHAGKCRFLHFACHGIAEEYAGRSQSMLVLSQPERFAPGDDGMLKLDELLHGWRGRLAACRLVVLSACKTNVGPTLRDEAPQALALGFFVAGAPSVISSLWAVDDASTRELMTEFYSSLAQSGSDRLSAFTKAKKKLRAKYADPYHWAPFLYLGIPE